MGKRKKTRGKTRFHRQSDKTPISVHEDANLALYWHRACDFGQEDSRGFQSLYFPVGWVSDEEDRWRLWFSGPPKRRDAQPNDYPFFWEYIEYTDSGSRKKPAALEAVSPVTLNPSMPEWSPRELRLIPELNKAEAISRKTPLVKNKLEVWDLGVRTVKSIAYPIFHAVEDDEGCISIELHPYSTAKTLLRVIEQAMIHLPKKTIKDTELEPLLKATEFLSAMDYENFGMAASMLAGRYVNAFALTIPKPYRSLILPGFATSADEELKLLATESQKAVSDLSVIRKLIDDGPDDGLISVEQIAIHLANDKRARGATTPRRIAEKFDHLGVHVFHDAVLGASASLCDYRNNCKVLLQHGNSKWPK